MPAPAKYTEVMSVIKRRIREGDYLLDNIPGERKIAEETGVSYMTARRAVQELLDEEAALANTLAMTHITLKRNGAFTLPALDFAGTPACIDVRRVVDTGLLPVINTGIAHKEPGVGQIGAGVTRAPLACFTQAVAALATEVAS